MAGATVITTTAVGATTAAETRSGDLWLPVAELPALTGWELKPEGVCRDDQCIPIPASDESAFRHGGHFNFSRFAGHTGMVEVHDAPAAAWSYAEGETTRPALADTLMAPDFVLPDLDGKTHRLSDFRGRKVFLASWASW